VLPIERPLEGEHHLVVVLVFDQVMDENSREARWGKQTSKGEPSGAEEMAVGY